MDTTKNSTMQERRAALDAAVSAALDRLASQSARIAELEGALDRMCNLFLQEGPKDAYEWAGYQHARSLLSGGE